MQHSLAKAESLARLARLPSLIMYAAWDIKHRCWSRHHPNYVLMPGIWTSEADALKTVGPNHNIIHIDFSHKIPANVLSILELNNFTNEEKRTMVLGKLSQLVELFVFRNKELKEQLNEQIQR